MGCSRGASIRLLPLGAYLDPIADKVLLSGVYISLAVARSIPSWLVVVILGRDLFLLATSGIALLFTAYREFRPSVWGKASTFVQIACATTWMAQNALNLRSLNVLAPSSRLARRSHYYLEWTPLQLARISLSKSALTEAAGRSRLEVSGLE